MIAGNGAELVWLGQVIGELGFRELRDEEIRMVAKSEWGVDIHKISERELKCHDKFVVAMNLGLSEDEEPIPAAVIRRVGFKPSSIIISSNPPYPYFQLNLKPVLLVTSHLYLIPILHLFSSYSFVYTFCPTLKDFQRSEALWLPNLHPIALEKSSALVLLKKIKDRGVGVVAKRILADWMVKGFSIKVWGWDFVPVKVVTTDGKGV